MLTWPGVQQRTDKCKRFIRFGLVFYLLKLTGMLRIEKISKYNVVQTSSILFEFLTLNKTIHNKLYKSHTFRIFVVAFFLFLALEGGSNPEGQIF